MNRGKTTVLRFLKSKTYRRGQGLQRSSGKGKRPISTPIQDTHLVDTLKQQRKLNVGKRPTTAKAVRNGSNFPGSLRTARRRIAKGGRKARNPRNKCTLTDGDVVDREAWCRVQVLRPITFWEEDVVFIDCKCFRIMLSEAQRDYARMGKVTFVIRTKSEGLLPECVKPGPQHKPGNAGLEKIFMAVFRGRVVAWVSFRKWNARTYTRCLNILSGGLRLRGVLGNGRRVVLVHDNDPSLKSGLGMRHAARLGFDSLPLPVRSPELMPHDFSMWKRILGVMQAYEDAPGYVRESVAAYRTRLQDTALGLAEVYVRSVQRKVRENAARIIAKGGQHINEGTKRTGER